MGCVSTEEEDVGGGGTTAGGYAGILAAGKGGNDRASGRRWWEAADSYTGLREQVCIAHRGIMSRSKRLYVSSWMERLINVLT